MGRTVWCGGNVLQPFMDIFMDLIFTLLFSYTKQILDFQTFL